MRLSREVYRDEYSSHTKETFYNDKDQITGILETGKSASGENGLLSIYDYSGENYRVVKYGNETKSYAAFIAEGHTILGKNNWHSVAEASSTREFKFEKGLLIADHYHNIEYGTKSSLSCSYQNGLKVSETRTTDDNTILRTDFTYQNGVLQAKRSFTNNQFTDQIIYVYGNNQLLLEEQKFLKHKETQYLSSQKNFFYNAKKQVEKTEYYGRYDSKMQLYKVEEEIRQGNVLTKKSAVISNVETMIGYYDLAAMHDMLKQQNMEWAISMFGKKYFETATFDAKSCIIEKYDDHGNMIDIKSVHPDTGETYGNAVFRNEYNDKSLLEFIISYRITEDGKMEESDIKKFYYRD